MAMKGALRWIITRLQGGEQPDGVNIFGWVIWFVEKPSPGLVYHETVVHPAQRRRDGWWRWHWRYLWQLVTVGYENIDYEQEARREQERVNAEAGWSR